VLIRERITHRARRLRQRQVPEFSERAKGPIDRTEKVTPGRGFEEQNFHGGEERGGPPRRRDLEGCERADVGNKTPKKKKKTPKKKKKKTQKKKRQQKNHKKKQPDPKQKKKHPQKKKTKGTPQTRACRLEKKGREKGETRRRQGRGLSEGLNTPYKP